MSDFEPLSRAGPGRRGRVLAHGGLKLVLLRLIAEKPSHGYELIKAIEEQVNGSYSPSPGVVYPALTLLEEMGYVSVGAVEGGRKLHTITDAGLQFFESQRDEADAHWARLQAKARAHAERPPQIQRAVENFKLAVHMRLQRGPLTEEQAHAFAAVLDSAAQNIEKI
ncbi:PadR family transcriptional regulator [Ottowia thiooxydans]|uniref:PadR family transcriptional regulator n=1 Tax=Ottowia thiooxydans TaxID=219182 RepID=UPI0004285733|nr:PadR family transcriptional regulator [Ottowia thiooxydans]